MTKSIVYFTAGATPTTAEIADIAVLNALTEPGFSVAVRNSLQSNSFGYGIEVFDLAAGTIPDAYSEVTEYGLIDEDRPVLFTVGGGGESLAVSATLKLRAIKVIGTDISDLTADEVNAGADGTVWSTSNAERATVSSSGVVTGVGAGAVTITATHTYATDKTIVATAALTVTA